VIIVGISWLFRHTVRGQVMPWFKNLQRMSAAFMAFSHGRNDAQKPMGILAVTLAVYFGTKEVSVPLWIVLSCAGMASLGMAFGGWRIIRTLGMRMTALDPVQGFAAEVSGASVIQLASHLGIPISTTHAITSSSPAYDVGVCTNIDLVAVLTDQRGGTRPSDITCDIGAFEVNSLDLIAPILAEVTPIPAATSAAASASCAARLTVRLSNSRRWMSN